jgi:hypothetical protein
LTSRYARIAEVIKRNPALSHGLRRGLLAFALTGEMSALSIGYASIPAIRSAIGESATFMSHTR